MAELTIGDVEFTKIVREGRLQDIVGYSGYSLTRYEKAEEKWDDLQLCHLYTISTELSVLFDDNPDNPETINFPLQISLPLTMRPEEGFRVRYTFESVEPVTQEKLDAYELAGVPFGSHDEAQADKARSLYVALDEEIEPEEFVDVTMAMATNRNLRMTFEIVHEGGNALREYTFKTNNWDKELWEEYREKVNEIPLM